MNIKQTIDFLKNYDTEKYLRFSGEDFKIECIAGNTYTVPGKINQNTSTIQDLIDELRKIHTKDTVHYDILLADVNAIKYSFACMIEAITNVTGLFNINNIEDNTYYLLALQLNPELAALLQPIK